jgi:hypothetical protein
VENKTEIMHLVLKRQEISLLPKYLTLFLGFFYVNEGGVIGDTKWWVKFRNIIILSMLRCENALELISWDVVVRHLYVSTIDSLQSHVHTLWFHAFVEELLW